MNRTQWRRLSAALAAHGVALVPDGRLRRQLVPPATSSASASKAPTTTFTVGFLQDVDSLNPFVGILASLVRGLELTYDT